MAEEFNKEFYNLLHPNTPKPPQNQVAIKISDEINRLKAEQTKRMSLQEQVREISGTLHFSGTDNATTDTTSFSFGFVRFLDEPNLVTGFKINNGTITSAQLAILGFEIDSKGMYSGVQFRGMFEGAGDWAVDIEYRLQGNCHLIYEQGDGFN